jgi:hypothetical protein
MVPAGNVIYKVKTGVKSHREDMAHLEAMRTAFGDAIDLRIDYNQALKPFGAFKILRDVEQLPRRSSSNRSRATTSPRWRRSSQRSTRRPWRTKGVSTAAT